jgi:8-oxo-dGTP pyrophosphatase MutT (NUDIX family)
MYNAVEAKLSQPMLAANVHSGRKAIIMEVAALPYRVDPDGNIEVMLVSARGRQVWAPPKGNLLPDLRPCEAAAREAFEEAGVIGSVSTQPIGHYVCTKSKSNGASEFVHTMLFPLHVAGREKDWPGKGRRVALWFEPSSAARVVRELGLARLLKTFRPSIEQEY